MPLFFAALCLLQLEDDDPEQPGGEAGVLLEEAADSEDREE